MNSSATSTTLGSDWRWGRAFRAVQEASLGNNKSALFSCGKAFTSGMDLTRDGDSKKTKASDQKTTRKVYSVDLANNDPWNDDPWNNDWIKVDEDDDDCDTSGWIKVGEKCRSAEISQSLVPRSPRLPRCVCVCVCVLSVSVF
jgi:hypothetical protein